MYTILVRQPAIRRVLLFAAGVYLVRPPKTLATVRAF
jgi:hypothetical protein